MRKINYHHLYYVYVTAKHGSVAEAAKHLHVTPQTVSGQIALAEQLLGAKLFDRKGKRLYLNALGKVAEQYAQRIFALGNELADALDEQKRGRIANFSIGVTDVVPKVLAFDLLKPVIAAFPDTRFIFREGDLDSLTASMAVNSLDLIVADRPLLPGAHVKAHSHALGQTSISFFAAPALAKDYVDGFPDSLHNAPFLLSSDRASSRQALEAWFNSRQMSPKVVAEFDDSALLKLYGQEGYGIFCAPSDIRSHVCGQYHVVCIGTLPQLSEQFYLIAPDTSQPNQVIRSVLTSGRELFSLSSGREERQQEPVTDS